MNGRDKIGRFVKGRIMTLVEIEKHKGHPSWNKKERVEVECQNCHKRFLVISTMQFIRRFCSRSCCAQHTFTGRAKSQEHKERIGDANKGRLKGVHRAPQTEFKKGNISHNKGKPMPAETKKRISDSNKGRVPWNKGRSGYLPQETWQNRPQCQKGKNNTNWKGGRKAAKARDHHKRRELGFTPLNDCDDASWVAHHIDKEHILYIPERLHISVRHKLSNQDSMDTINKMAIDWYIDYYGLI